MNKPPRRFILLSALFLIISGHSRASNEGYYLNLSGDTVRGTFLKVPEIGNPSKVEFIPTGSSEVTILRSGEIKGFRVGAYDNYISYSGPRLLNSTDGSSSAEISTDNINTFLREIGETHGYSILSYSDSKRVNLFYSDDGARVEELRYLSSVPMSGDYKDQLKLLLSSKVDTNILMPLINKLVYSEEGMANFIEELNESTDVHSIPQLKGFFAMVGYSYNIFSATGSNAIPAVSTNYSEGGSWLVGFGYMKPLRKGGGGYFIFPSIKAFSYETSGTIRRYNGDITNSFSSDLVLYPAFNVGYHLINKASTRFFVSPGFGFLVLLNNKEESTYDYFDGTKAILSSEETQFTFDVNVKTGVVLFQRYMFWLTYNIPTPVTSDSNYNGNPYTGNLSGFQGGIGVRF